MIDRRLPAALATSAVLLAASAPGAPAAPPPPFDSAVFAFPGSFASPASAASAGLGLADRWLGLAPETNPAAAPARGVVVAPMVLRTSRQDLAAANREFDEQFAYADFAGARLTAPVAGLSLSLYAWQPALRLESTSYTAGVPGTPLSASVANEAESRELRAGAALSRPFGALRFGVAVEWGQRTETASTVTQSGAPESGTREASFDGTSLGGAAGLAWDRGSEAPGGWRLGAAVRFEGALDVTGESAVRLLALDSTAAVSATREALAEAGLSAAYTLTAEAHLYASLGTRPGETWTGFGVESATGTLWSVGADYHDPETPWTARLGVGQEVRPGTPEPRAGLLGIGLGYQSGDLAVEAGLLHRTVQRPGSPNLADERLVVSVGVHF
jgi:hypothetical protein